MKSEAQANAALHDAAQRINWEDSHQGAWMRPAPKRAQRNGRHAADYVLAVMLACTILALTLGAL
jgi:hypothetical protein